MPENNRKRIAIVGRQQQTTNYQKALEYFDISYEVTLSVGSLSAFDALLLPGGGDINPTLIHRSGEHFHHVDTELDLIQFQALQLFVKNKKPVLGICKGFQLMELYFGSDFIANLPAQSSHQTTPEGEDSLHPVFLSSHKLFSFDNEVFTAAKAANSAQLPHLYSSLPKVMAVNSAHHQGITKNGAGLISLQTASDGIVETVCHETLPLLAFQWHPERLLLSSDPSFVENGKLAFTLFFSLLF